MKAVLCLTALCVIAILISRFNSCRLWRGPLNRRQSDEPITFKDRRRSRRSVTSA